MPRNPSRTHLALVLALTALSFSTAALAADEDKPGKANFTKKGVTIVDDGGANALNFDLLFQPRYVMYSSGNPDTTDLLKNAGSGFQMRRMLVYMNGKIARKLEYKFRMYLAKASSGTYGAALDDAQVTYAGNDSFNLSVGQFKVPYSAAWLTSCANYAFPEMSVAWNGVSYGSVATPGFSSQRGRDIGTMIHGGFSKNLVQYQAGVFSGDGASTYPPLDNGYLFAGRVQVSPMGDIRFDEIDFSHNKPQIAIGLSANQNRLPNYDTDGSRDGQTTDTRLGAEFRFTASGFYGAAEYYRATIAQSWSDADPLGAYGYYLMGTYDLGWYNIAPGVRYSMLEPNADSNVEDDRLTGYEAVINYFYPRPGRQKKVKNDDLGHSAQMQVAYGMFKQEGLDHTLYSQFTLGVQLGLPNL